MILARRRFLQCLTGIIAAPAVVKADSLMRVFAPKPKTIFYNPHPYSDEEIELIIRPPLMASPELMLEPASIMPRHITYLNRGSRDGFWPLFDSTTLPAAHQRV